MRPHVIRERMCVAPALSLSWAEIDAPVLCRLSVCVFVCVWECECECVELGASPQAVSWQLSATGNREQTEKKLLLPHTSRHHFRHYKALCSSHMLSLLSPVVYGKGQARSDLIWAYLQSCGLCRCHCLEDRAAWGLCKHDRNIQHIWGALSVSWTASWWYQHYLQMEHVCPDVYAKKSEMCFLL